MVDPWKTLGIAPTDDLRRIKKAYAARVKRAHPEDDPEGFQTLRQAYDIALAFAHWRKEQRGHGQEEWAADTAFPASGRLQRRIQTGSWPSPMAAVPVPASELRALDSQWATVAAAELMTQVERLHDDAEAWTSEGSWRALLASESLWNVDTRGFFQRWLLELLVCNDSGLNPAVWCLLEQEFNWTEQALSLYRTLPREGVDRVLDRIERAPIESAEHLCEEGRYREAIALLKPIAFGRRAGEVLAGRARGLLDRCYAGERAERLMSQIRLLHADERAWASEPAWRTLLAHHNLRDGETRGMFEKKLFDFLIGHGRGLGADVWQLLDREYRWSRRLSEEHFARLQEHLGPAIDQIVERLCDEGRYREAIVNWGQVVARLTGELAPRGRLALDRCYLAVIEEAERLVQQGRYREAIGQIPSVGLSGPGELGARLGALVGRCGLAAIENAERLYDKRRYREAIGQVESITPRLDGEPRTRAELLLARCYLMACSPRKAEALLKELLGRNARCIPAHLLMAVVYRSAGRLASAQDAYRQVLRIAPDDRGAAAGLADVQRQLAAGQGARGPARGRTERPAPESFNPLWLLLVISLVNGLGRWRLDWPGEDDVRLLAMAVPWIVLIGAALAGGLISRRRQGSAMGLNLGHDPHAWRLQSAEPGLDGVASGGEPRSDPAAPTTRRLIKGLLVALVVTLAIALIWWGP